MAEAVLSATPVVRTAPIRRGPLVAPLVMVGRSLRLASREPDAILVALALPIMLMLLFVYLFGGAMEVGTAYLTYVVPGVLLLSIGFGSASTAVSVSRDLSSGLIDRFRSLDVGGTSLLVGHVAASAVRNAVASSLVVAVAVLIGYRPHADLLGWLGAAGVVLLFVVALSWVSAAFGVLARTPEAAAGFSFFLSFVTYPSSAFVPVATMPHWLRGFAGHQPVTYVVEALRRLLLDQPVGDDGWFALAWSLGIVAVGVAASAVLYRRRVG
jgi:ABC-2 type transport system permease protein